VLGCAGVEVDRGNGFQGAWVKFESVCFGPEV